MTATEPPPRRVALVTAASRGLGFASAGALAAAGHDLVVGARDPARLEAAAARLRAHGVEVAAVPVDVADATALEGVFEHVDARFGRLDVLVANAGGPPPGTFGDLDDDAWQRGFELTLMSAVRSLRLAIPRMRAGGFGRLVVIGSSSVRQPLPGLVLSNAYRPALAGVVKSLAVELGPDGITANLVSPGRIDTDRVRSLDAGRAERTGRAVEEVRAEAETSIPMGRYGEPAELGAAVAFLASESAGYLTGQSLLVDGGLVPTLP